MAPRYGTFKFLFFSLEYYVGLIEIILQEQYWKQS